MLCFHKMYTKLRFSKFDFMAWVDPTFPTWLSSFYPHADSSIENILLWASRGRSYSLPQLSQQKQIAHGK